MTDIVKCSKCRQKLDKDFAIIQSSTGNEIHLPASGEEATYNHQGCLTDTTDHVVCQLCDKPFKMITPGHLTKHDLTVREYKLRYGPVISESQRQRLGNQSRVSRGGDPELREKVVNLQTQLVAALATVSNHSDTIEELTESLESQPTITSQLDEVARSAGVEIVNTGPRTIGVVFTMEEIENIGAVALREMVKCKFGRFESRKADNIEKLRGLVE